MIKLKIKIVIFSVIIAFFTFSIKAELVKLEESLMDYELLDIELASGTPLYEAAELYRYNEEYLLPLELLSQVLEVNAFYNVTENKLIGSINDENFEIDFDSLPPNISGYIAVIDNALFLDSKSVSELLGIEVKVYFSQLKMTVQANFPLPIETRLAREGRVIINQPNRAKSYPNIIPDQYRLFTPFKGQVNATYNYTEDEQTTNASVQLYNDLAYHSSKIYLSSNGDTTRADINFSRYQSSPNKKIGNLLTHYEFGDVKTSSNRSKKSYYGVGVKFANTPTRLQSHFGTTSIYEQSQPGWQVELYQHGFLIATTEADSNGHINFNNIQVQYGINRFQIKLYGPYGEIETREKEIIIGQSQLLPGQLSWSGSIISNNQKLFNDNLELNTDLSSPAIQLGFDYGFTENLSIVTSLFSGKANPIDEEETKEASIGIQSYFDNSVLELSYFSINNKQSRIEGSLLGLLGNQTRYNLNSSYFEQVLSNNERQYLSDYSLSLTRRFNNVQVSLNQGQAFANVLNQESRTDNTSLGLSFRLGNFFIRNITDYQYRGIDKSTLVSNNTSMSSTYSSGHYTVSAEVGHDPKLNNTELTRLSSSIYYKGSQALYLGASADYQITNDEYSISSHMNWKNESYNIISEFGYDSVNKWNIRLGVSFNLDYDYYNDQILIQSDYGAQTATLDLFNYIDNNKNKRYDEYDQPLPDVLYGHNKAWAGVYSNKQGFTYLPAVKTRTPVTLTTDATFTEYYNTKATDKNLVFYSHPGGVIKYDIPYNYMIGLDGQFVDETELQVARYVPVELYTLSGRLVHQTSSGVDGTYSIDNVEAGKYTLKIPEEYLTAKKIIAEPNNIELQFNGSNDYINVPTIKFYDQTNFIPSSQQTKTIDKINDESEVFSIQFGVFNDREYCNLRVEQLKESGINEAFYSMETNACKVYVGEFPSNEQAEQYRQNINSELLGDAFVTEYREGDDIYSVHVSSFAIQLSAYSAKEQCKNMDKESVRRQLGITEEIYILHKDNYCKVYIGDFLNKKAATDLIKTLPKELGKKVFILKR